mgnify:CR=1 FL=1
MVHRLNAVWVWHDVRGYRRSIYFVGDIMTRKQAILACLMAPFGRVTMEADVQAPRGTVSPSGLIIHQKLTTELRITMADEAWGDASLYVTGGLDSLRVTYNGQEKIISAREIWDAIAEGTCA